MLLGRVWIKCNLVVASMLASVGVAFDRVLCRSQNTLSDTSHLLYECFLLRPNTAGGEVFQSQAVRMVCAKQGHTLRAFVI
jgi:hypothetical protein